MVATPALRRDVLQWLVSLNLSFPIKNVKRDFSNGFLVAEILSRYYPHDVQMHSFDYGTKLAKKKDNWEQLKKIFWKEEIPFVQDEINDIINCGPHDSVGSFLERLYCFLTHKRYKPEEVDVDELWHGVPDTTVLFTNDMSTLSKDDCSFLENAGDIDAFCISQSKGKRKCHDPIEEADTQDFYEDDDVLVEMNFQKDEFDISLDHVPEISQECQPNADVSKDGIDKEQLHHNAFENVHTRNRKTIANAVERARQRDRKAKRKDNPPKASHVTEHVNENLKSKNRNLAFRSPNRPRHFRTYTLKDYRKQQTGVYVELGKLGPDTTEELLNQREKLEKMKAFGRIARDINVSQTAEIKRPKEKRQSCREKAKEFASKLPKPKRKVLLKENLNAHIQSSPPVMSEIEKMEARHQKDIQKIEAIRRDLECFLR